MIDTIVIESPFISEEIKIAVEQFCERRTSLDIASGEIKYEYTTGSLMNSSDCRLSLKVLTEKWEYDTLSGHTLKLRSEPYLRIECSIHKQMLGHNVYGGSSDFQGCIRWLISSLNERIGVILPSWESWKVLRIDVAEIFVMSSKEVVSEWFRLVQRVEYSRRNVKSSRYGESGIYFPGTSTTTKIYHKGIEFKKNDYKRVKLMLGDDIANRVLELADKIIRVEVEVKSRKLRYDFGSIPVILQIDDDYLRNIFDDEVKKMKLDMNDECLSICNRSKEVEKILYSGFNAGLAGALYGMWVRLSAFGESEVRKTMTKSTFQKYKKLLRDSGVSWLNTDIMITSSIVPADFIISRNDRHYWGYALENVIDMIEKCKIA